MLKHLSFSQANQLRTCGWQYKLQRIDRHSSRPSCAAVAGTLFHSASEVMDGELHDNRKLPEEKYIQIGLDWLSKNAQTYIDLEVEASDGEWPTEKWRRFGRVTAAKPNGEDMTWFLAEGIPNAVRALAHWRYGNGRKFGLAEIDGFGPAVELPFNLYIGNQLVHGYIDRLFTDGEGLYPVDYKTGRKPKSLEQLALYAEALRRAGVGDINYGWFIYSMKLGPDGYRVTDPVVLSDWTSEKLEQIYLPVANVIESGNFIPNPGDACFACSLSHACDFYKASAV